MARNRKRAKERRARRPQPVGTRARNEATRGVRLPEPAEDGAPAPLEHATPDAELAEEQIEFGAITDAELDEPEIGEEQVDEAAFEAEEEPEQETAEPSAGPIAEPRQRTGSRLITFLEGSWRELQRVQWPDRRQVMQATGVVLGFVFIAGIWLGISDWGAKHIVNFILYGHF